MNTRAVALGLALLLSRPGAAAPSPEAEQAYRNGQSAFDQANYGGAIVAWERSYALSHAAGLLYNLGQAYRLRAQPGDCARARRAYQRYAEAASPSPQRQLAEGYIAQLASCAATATTRAPATSIDAARPVRGRELAVAAIAAGGVALIASGAYLGHHASTLGHDVTAACGSAGGCDWSLERTKDAAGRRDATLGTTFGVLGGLALVGSAAMYWLGVHDREVRLAPVVLHGNADGAVLTWSGQW